MLGVTALVMGSHSGLPCERGMMTVNKLSRKTLVTGICLGLLLLGPAVVSAEAQNTTSNEDQASGGATTQVNGTGVNATSIGAWVQGGSQNVAVGNSTQIINGTGIQADNYGALIIGGSGNTAIGTNAQVAEGSSLEAVGYGAFAGEGNNNTAIGNNAYAGGKNGYMPNPSDNNVAIGYGAFAYGGNTVAIGANSVANEANTVSVGQPGYERRIMNVAPGYYGTDAVNMSQLWTLDSKVNRVGAMAFAMSALAPLPYDPKDPTQYSAGIGTYNGQSAVALGIYHYTKPTVMLNAAVAMSDDKWEKSARMGITWRTGGPKPKALIPASAVTAAAFSEPDGGIMSRINKIIAADLNP